MECAFLVDYNMSGPDWQTRHKCANCTGCTNSAALMAVVSYTASARNWLSLSIWTEQGLFLQQLYAHLLQSVRRWRSQMTLCVWPCLLMKGQLSKVGWSSMTFLSHSVFQRKGLVVPALPSLPGGPQSVLLRKHGFSGCVCPGPLCPFWPFEHSGMWLWLLPPQPSGNITGWGLRVLLEKNTADKWLCHAAQ